MSARPYSRQRRAATFLEGLGPDYDAGTILVGPDIPGEERQPYIDFSMETRIESLCDALLDDMGSKERIGRGPAARIMMRNVLAQFCEHALAEGEVSRIREDGIRYLNVPSHDEPDWIVAQVAIGETENGPALAGIYFHTSLYVLPDWRRIGIGSDLVTEHALHNGQILNWDLDSCAYSPDGEKAHLRALDKIHAIAKAVECTISCD